MDVYRWVEYGMVILAGKNHTGYIVKGKVN